MYGDFTWADVDPKSVCEHSERDILLREKWVDCCMGKISMEEWNTIVKSSME